MREVVCNELGPPSVLRIEERPDPEARAGQVLIAVEAAGVNYVDALFVAGEYQIKPPLPFVPGSEVAGTVVAVGEGTEGIEVGRRVLASVGLGGYASHVVCRAAQVTPLPDGLDAARAAAFTQSYCTALFALRERARVAPGEVVLVLGAGGGVGLAAIDVAVALGARVIAVASTDDKRSAALAQGAEAAIDPAVEDVKTRARALAGKAGVDVVVDPIGGDLAELALRSLDLFGRYLVIGFAAGAIPRLPLNQVLLRNRSILGIDWGAWGMAHADENQVLLTDGLAMVADGRLHPVAPATYPLERVADALVDLRERRVTGKVVLVP